MPNIRSYDSRATGQGARTGVDTGALSRGLQPNNMGVSALDRAAGDQAAAGSRIASMAAQSGRAIEEGVGAVANTVADVAEQYYSRQEVLKNGAKQAEKLAELTGSWNKTRNEADPNDPLVAKRWNEEVLMPALNDMSKGLITAAGQRMSDEFRERMLNTFALTQEADQRIANVKAAEINVGTLANASALTAKSDPMMLATVNENVTATIDAYVKNSNFTAAEVAHFEDLKQSTYATNTQAAFIAMADANPAKAREALANGWAAKYITPEIRQRLENYADGQERMIAVEARAKAEAQRKAEKDAAGEVSAKITTSIIQPDGSLALTPDFFQNVKQMALMPGADDGTARALISLGKSLLDEKDAKFLPSTDPYTSEDFRQRMRLPADDPRTLTLEQIARAREEKKLSDKEFSYYTGMLSDLRKDPKKKDAMDEFDKFLNLNKGQITRSNALYSMTFPKQDANYYAFTVSARKAFEKAYKDGTWEKALDPTSPGYLGAMIPKYQLSKAQAQQEFMEVMSVVDLATGKNTEAAKKRYMSIEDFKADEAKSGGGK